jgi:hypothetical protein
MYADLEVLDNLGTRLESYNSSRALDVCGDRYESDISCIKGCWRLTSAAEKAFCVLSLVSQDVPQVQYVGGLSKTDQPAVAYFASSLVTTVTTTLLIVFRIVYLTWGDIRKYHAILEIVIESAAAYSLLLVVTLPFTIQNNLNGGYPQAMLGPVAVGKPFSSLVTLSKNCYREYHPP